MRGISGVTAGVGSGLTKDLNIGSVVRATADLSKKQGRLTSPSTYRRADQWLSSSQLSQILWTCGKYLDFCNEYGITDDLGLEPLTPSGKTTRLSILTQKAWSTPATGVWSI